jgi:hypothetical protein
MYVRGGSEVSCKKHQRPRANQAIAPMTVRKRRKDYTGSAEDGNGGTLGRHRMSRCLLIPKNQVERLAMGCDALRCTMVCSPCNGKARWWLLEADVSKTARQQDSKTARQQATSHGPLQHAYLLNLGHAQLCLCLSHYFVRLRGRMFDILAVPSDAGST